MKKLLYDVQQGHVDEQYRLGHMYYYGKEVKQDYKEAFVWFRKAAEQRDSDAQYSLGFICYYGQGVEIDYRKAVTWYKEAAKRGHAVAQNNLGDMCTIMVKKSAQET